MRPVVLDTETSIFMKGAPYAQRNKLCYVGFWDSSGHRSFKLDGFGEPYGQQITAINGFLGDSQHGLVIGFNIKFDLAWVRRYGISLKDKRVWDLQLAEFIINNQSVKMPSLNNTCERVGLGRKLDVVAVEYWAKNIDTPQVPQELMLEYLENDCKIEWDLFHWQMNYLKDKPKLKRLIWDSCQDLLITHEMEWNGLLYAIKESKQIGDEIVQQIQHLDRELSSIVDIPVDKWNSNDYLSAILYGGQIDELGVEPYTFVYKDGRTIEKLRKVKIPRIFPRLVEPLDGTKVKKEGFWSVDEGTLRKLKADYGVGARIIQLVLQRNKLEKKVSTYYHGFPKLYEEMDWSDDILHGQLNHCVAGTGRLSSSRPNQQNMDGEVRQCIKTRFPLALATSNPKSIVTT